ncbi:hypothetical protein ABPG74_009760 [Tetrahymena malaccensis]
MIKQFLIISLSIALIQTTPGQDTTCNGNTNDVASCGPAGNNGQWEKGAVFGSRLVDTSAITLQKGLFDTFCTSFNFLNPYVKQTQDGCQKQPAIMGANVACASSTNCNNCGNAPTPAFIWQNVDTTNCQIKSCLAAPMPTSGLTDYFCTSCGQTNKFANFYGSACVNPTGGSCTRKTGWTNEDCIICNQNGSNSANQYANSDKTQCVATAPSAYSSSSYTQVFYSLIIAALLL